MSFRIFSLLSIMRSQRPLITSKVRNPGEKAWRLKGAIEEESAEVRLLFIFMY